MYRVGIIGTGNVCRHAHLPAYAALDQLQITALYDKDRGAAEAAKEEYGFLRAQITGKKPSSNNGELKVCSSAEDLLKEVDIVDICTSLRYHAFYAAMALERNVNVMTEKPMARSWWEARYVAQLAEKSSALFQLNDDNVFIPRYLLIRNLIESGYIGDVQNVRIVRGGCGSNRARWFFDGLEAGGGALFDYGSHAATSTWFLIGFDKELEFVRSLGIKVKERTRMVQGRMQSIEIDDDAHFKILFRNPKNGDWITVVIEATWAEPEMAHDGSDVHGYVEVQGDEGSIRTACDDQGEDCLMVSSSFFGERDILVKDIQSEGESIRTEITNFVESIRANTDSVLNAKIGEKTIQILNMAQLSELTGRISVTAADLESFCAEVVQGDHNPWEAGDRISVELTRPYRYIDVGGDD
jgi:predicted dehydrogenase